MINEGLCKVDHCQFFSESSWICNGCSGRFELVNKEYCQTRNCTLNGDNGICLACHEKYDLIDGDCLLKNCVDRKEAFCTECMEGWKLDVAGFCSIRDCKT